MSTQVEGGRPLARLSVLGFPVHVDLSFVIVIAILGYLSWRSVTGTLWWMAVAPFAILIHELGHAVLARTTGARPSIALVAFGGLTTFTPPAPLSRGRSFAISVAGPLVGLAVGVPLHLVSNPLLEGGQLPDWAYVLLKSAVWTTVGWSLLNLLPILPLDGGQAMRELLPGDPATRQRRAAAASVAVSVAVAVLSWLAGQGLLAAFFAFFAVSNALSLRTPAGPQPPSPGQQVFRLLWEGRAEQARALLAAQPPGAVDDLAIHGAVLACTGEVDQGLALLRQELARRPADPDVAALLAHTHLLRRDWEAFVAFVSGLAGAAVPAVVIERAVRTAEREGRQDVVARLGGGG